VLWLRERVCTRDSPCLFWLSLAFFFVLVDSVGPGLQVTGSGLGGIVVDFRMNAVRRISKRLSGRGKDNLSNDLVQFKSVPLQKLLELQDQVENGKLAQGVELYQITEDVSDDLKKGDTVRVIKKPPGQEATGDLPRKESGFLTMLVPEPKWTGLHRKDGQMVEVTFPPSKIKKKFRVDWTVEDMTHYVIMVQTAVSQESWVSSLDKSEKGSSFQGVFVCVGPRTKFQDLIFSLKAYFDDVKQAKADRYVWLEATNLNYHMLASKSASMTKYQYLLESSLHRAIDRFDDRVVAFDRWEEPLVLKNLMAIWELYGMTSGGKTFRIVTPRELDEEILEMLRKDFRMIQGLYATFTAREGTGTDFTEQEMLGAIFEDKNGGISMLNAKIHAALRVSILEKVNATLKQRVTMLGESSLEAADLLTQMGLLLTQEQWFEHAIEYLRAALKTKRAKYGGNDMRVAHVLGYLAHALADQGKPNQAFKAIVCYEEELAITRRIMPKNHPDIATVLNNLACLLEDMGDLDEALRLYLEALEIRKQSKEKAQPEEEALLLVNIGSLYHSKENFEGALEYNESALEIYRSIDPAHERITQLQCNLAVIYHSMGKEDEAMVKLQEAEKDASSEARADVILLRANILDNEGQYKEALELYDQAYKDYAERLGTGHTQCATVLNFIAAVYQAQGKPKDALVKYEEALKVRREVLGEAHPDTAQVLFNMAQCLQGLKKYEEALNTGHQALKIYKKTCGDSHPDTVDCEDLCVRIENHITAKMRHKQKKDAFSTKTKQRATLGRLKRGGRDRSSISFEV